MAGQPFPDPVIAGGGALVQPSIHSPGYVSGTTGWQVAQDGSAEFQLITARGDIQATGLDGTDFAVNADGIFFYAGPPPQ